MRIRYGCYEVDKVESLEAALESALAEKSAALEEVASMRSPTGTRTPCTHIPVCGCFANGHREGRIAGIAEANARWGLRLERLRAQRDSWAHQAVDQVWHELDKAIAIMLEADEVTP